MKQYGFLVIGFLVGALVVYTAMRSVPADKSAASVEIEVPVNNQRITGYPLPEAISFAGETVPLERADVFEKLDREIQVNAFWHSNSILLIKRAAKWLPTIDSILAANEIPGDFKYLCVAESGLQNVISPKNAVGFWQFLKGTAQDFGLIINSQVDQRYDPMHSTVAATKYLKEAFTKYKNWTLVAASYNMGMKATAEAIANQGASSYYDLSLSEEPSRYVFRILALKELLENPEKYGFDIGADERYKMTKSKSIIIDLSVSDWSEFAQTNQTNYYQLKQLNPWIRKYNLTLRKGQTMEVRLPVR